MSDIVIRNSDGRVFAAGDSIVDENDRYGVTINGELSHVLKGAFGAASHIVANVNLPNDLVAGFNYNYVNGAFVSSGEAPPPAPTPVVPPFWSDCASIARNEFIPTVVSAITPTGYSRIRNDTNGSWVFDTIMSSDTIDPNALNAAGRNLFDDLLNYLLATNAASDGQKLLLPAGRDALHSAWRKK